MSYPILIYNGLGTSELCVKAWEREIKEMVDPRFYQTELFSGYYDAGLDQRNIALIVIPGGYSPQISSGITQVACKINQAVNSTATFLGSCAGSIATCSSFAETLAKPASNAYAKLSQIDINPLLTYAPYHLANPLKRLDLTNKTTVEVEIYPSFGNTQLRVCQLYHAWGPAFPMQSLDPGLRYNCRVMAKYKTAGLVPQEQEPAAAILYRPPQHGSTRRLFTGIHPELGLQDIQSEVFAASFDHTNRYHINVLAERLQNSEIIRKEICAAWLCELGISLRPT